MYQYYYVKGWDKKTDDTVVLFEGDHKEAIINWAKRYSSKEDAGGWDKIFVSHYYQIDVDWEGEPVYSEHVVWCYYREPMEWSDNAMEEF
jgi:hypothetical protein